jgi:uncharacterized protein YbjT (DUF2867 family)
MMSTAVIGATGRVSAAAGISSIEQVTRLSVLNASADSLGINQRAHHSIDQFAAAIAVPYSTIRPAIFSASLLAAAPEVRASRTWTGWRPNSASPSPSGSRPSVSSLTA